MSSGMAPPPGAGAPPRGRMTVRLSPEGSFHDNTAPGGAAASAARPGTAPRCVGAPSESGSPAKPEL